MQLPNAHLVLVGSEKITKYLLNPAHPDNGGKAAFFTALGFRTGDWELLAAAFRKLALNNQVAKCLETSHGCKYVLDGAIETPCGKQPQVRTVWLVGRGQNCPRLVTAYPQEHNE